MTRELDSAGLMKWTAFLKRVGIDAATGLRWRRTGKITPSVNIDGKLYLRQAELDEFLRRADAGEFAKDVQTPNRTK